MTRRYPPSTKPCHSCGQELQLGALSCPVCMTWCDVQIDTSMVQVTQDETVPFTELQDPDSWDTTMPAVVEEESGPTIHDSLALADDRELEFVKNLLRNGRNCKAAAIAAGYGYGTAHTHSQGWIRATREESKKPHLWDIYEYEKHRQLDRLDITENSVIMEIARLAMFDPGKLFYPDGSVKPIDQLDEDTRRCIGGIDIGSRFAEDGMMERILKVKMSEKRAALDLLTKVLGMQQLNVNVKHGFGAMMEEIMNEEEPLVQDAEYEEVDDGSSSH